MVQAIGAEMVKLDVTCRDWRDAIREAASPLIKSNAITPQYVDAMFRIMEQMGPYFVIVRGIALAHARPEEGVLKSGVSFARLLEPVKFGHEDNDPVWLVIVLAGSTNNSHIELLRQLARFLGDAEALEALRRAPDPGKAAGIINKAFEQIAGN